MVLAVACAAALVVGVKLLLPADDVDEAPDAQPVGATSESPAPRAVRSVPRRTAEPEDDAPPPAPSLPAAQAPTPDYEGLRSALHGPSEETKSTIILGLRWFRDRQEEDGGWRDPATTGFVLLTYLGAGETHQAGSNRELVKKGLQRLRDGQGEDGCLVPPNAAHRLRDHAIAALALLEAYGQTASRTLKDPAQRAVAFALASRAPGGAWNLPAPDDAHIDVESTAWMAMVLKAAAMSELEVEKSALTDVAAALDAITDPATGRISARSPTTISDDAATAIGAFVRLWAGRTSESDALTATSIDALLARLPAADTTDLPYVYFGSLAMLTVGGERFLRWLPSLNAVAQRPSRDADPDRGSWDPPAGAPEDARLWTTAYHVRMGEFYYGRVGKAAWKR